MKDLYKLQRLIILLGDETYRLYHYQPERGLIWGKTCEQLHKVLTEDELLEDLTKHGLLVREDGSYGIYAQDPLSALCMLYKGAESAKLEDLKAILARDILDMAEQ